MKKDNLLIKILSQLFIVGIVFFSLSFHLVFATSGACSYNGGVDCNAGPSLLGYAQCYDGTISSVAFSAMAECTTSNSCSILDPTGQYDYTSEADCQALEAELIRDGVGQYTGNELEGDVLACKNQVTEYQAAEASYQSCLTTQAQPSSIAPLGALCDAPIMLCTSSTLQSYQSLLNQTLQSCENSRTGSPAICSNSTLTNEIQTCQQEIQTYQQQEQSYNSCLTTAKNAIVAASCDSQHYLSGNQCLPLPANSYSNGNGGYQCDAGYQSSNGGCAPPPNNYVANGVDLCDTGYIANPYHQCVSITPYQDPALATYCQQTFGYGSIVQNGSCACAVGYELNSSQTQCVAVPTATNSPSPLPTPTVAATSTPSTPAQTSFVINANLQLGSSGGNVMNLQKFLESKGFLILPSGTAEGYFGSLTKQALIVYQTSVGLPTTGFCGPMTRAIISNSQ